MSENKHTPEPWRVEIGEQPECIAVLCTSGLAHFEIVSDSQLGDIHADARRIVACVNALEGLNDYALSGGWSFRGIEAYAKGLEKQRDELLAAIERFMDSHEECTDFDGFTAQIVSMADYHQAQEAIARVKGEQW